MLDELTNKIKGKNIRIVLPESNSINILEAASYCRDNDICKITLIGEEEIIKKHIDTTNIDIIDMKKFNDKDKLIDAFYNLRKEKGLSYQEAQEKLENNSLYFSAMLVYLGYQDGMVAGKINTSKDVLKCTLETVGSDGIASSFFILENSTSTLLFADCSLNINPDIEKLIKITKDSVDSFNNIVNKTPKVAFLSHSTNSSTVNDKQNKMHNLVLAFKEKYSDIISDGEMQFDVAVNKDIQEVKYKDSKIKGDANIFIFPDIDSANISYKILEQLGGYKAYGPITQGLNMPINDLSRGSTTEDIIGVIIITCIQKLINN